MRWLRAILSALHPARPAPCAPAQAPLPRPVPPVCIIGDLHGRLDLLERMLARIATQPQAQNARLIFVGDIIDRGPRSAAVLERVRTLTEQNPDRIFCLMGNHERMLLDFLEDPQAHGPRWIANGGAETLASFGISPFGRAPMPALAQTLQDALPPGTLAWLRALPLRWQEDRLAVSHAGADPDVPFEAQSPARLLWGGGRRQGNTRRDGLWVAQGHVIVKKPECHGNSIMLDTGAWCHGRLSAAWIDEKALDFLTVTAE